MIDNIVVFREYINRVSTVVVNATATKSFCGQEADPVLGLLAAGDLERQPLGVELHVAARNDCKPIHQMSAASAGKMKASILCSTCGPNRRCGTLTRRPARTARGPRGPWFSARAHRRRWRGLFLLAKCNRSRNLSSPCRVRMRYASGAASASASFCGARQAGVGAMIGLSPPSLRITV